MRIAMMTNNYKPFLGGVPISIERLAGSLRQCGHEVDVFAPSYENQQSEPGVIRYKSCKRKLQGGIALPNVLDATLSRHFRAKPYDLIHTHHPMLIGYAALHFSRRHGIPLVMTYHTRYEQYLHYLSPFSRSSAVPEDGLRARAVTLHNKLITNECNMVFTPGASMKDYLAQNGTSAPIRILPTGLSAMDYCADGAKAAALRMQYAPAGQKLFCSVSRLEKEKNLPFLLESLAQYKAHGGAPFRLLLIGGGSERPALEAQAAALGLSGEVCFTGALPHDELRHYYAACDLFVFSSRSETQGIVLLEAMAASLPVVAVAASGINDVVIQGQNGLLSRPDPAAFAAQLAGATAHAPHYAQMRARARRTAEGYSAQAVARKAESYYTELFEGGRQRAYGYVYAR